MSGEGGTQVVARVVARHAQSQIIGLARLQSVAIDARARPPGAPTSLQSGWQSLTWPNNSLQIRYKLKQFAYPCTFPRGPRRGGPSLKFVARSISQSACLPPNFRVEKHGSLLPDEIHRHCKTIVRFDKRSLYTCTVTGSIRGRKVVDKNFHTDRTLRNTIDVTILKSAKPLLLTAEFRLFREMIFMPCKERENILFFFSS